MAAVISLAACVHRASITLEMSWKRGDDHFGPNFHHLESNCLSSPARSISKPAPIKNSQTISRPLEPIRVPVQFHVDCDANRQVVGGILESVGEWSEKRFQTNEKSLATGFRVLENQPSGSGPPRQPCWLFPQVGEVEFYPHYSCL